MRLKMMLPEYSGPGNFKTEETSQHVSNNEGPLLIRGPL